MLPAVRDLVSWAEECGGRTYTLTRHTNGNYSLRLRGRDGEAWQVSACLENVIRAALDEYADGTVEVVTITEAK